MFRRISTPFQLTPTLTAHLREPTLEEFRAWRSLRGTQDDESATAHLCACCVSAWSGDDAPEEWPSASQEQRTAALGQLPISQFSALSNEVSRRMMASAPSKEEEGK